MKFNIFIWSLLSTLFLCSCEEQLVMVPEFVVPESDRVVLIEELTGVSCPNCPTGTATIEQIKANYGKKVVAVGIHGNFLSWPTPENKYDFRNEYAKELEDYLKPWDGKPAASINRIQYTAERSISTPAVWSNYVDQELAKENVMILEMESTFDETTREVNLTVTLIPLKNFSTDDNLHLSVMVLESEIEDAQEDSNTIIEEFTHNHVLRTMLTPALGMSINKDLVQNQAEKFNFKYIIPLPEEGDLLWIPEHMELVSFVNTVDGDRKDVLQAAEIKIIE